MFSQAGREENEEMSRQGSRASRVDSLHLHRRHRRIRRGLEEGSFGMDVLRSNFFFLLASSRRRGLGYHMIIMTFRKDLGAGAGARIDIFLYVNLFGELGRSIGYTCHTCISHF